MAEIRNTFIPVFLYYLRLTWNIRSFTILINNRHHPFEIELY